MENLVVVVTGASSGIGRATAIEFARRGSSLALAARRETMLQDVASECHRLGGRAEVIPTDVTSEEAVVNLARRTIERFGRIDVWINNAAVSAFGRFEEMPADVFRRVTETNVFGYVYGARAALIVFRKQGRGLLINNASIVAAVSQPYTTAYVMSKHAIRALSMSLRQELVDMPDIRVCTVLPCSIDTPIFQHAANYTGRAIKPIPPVYSAEDVARAMIDLVHDPKREVIVGRSGEMLKLAQIGAPGLTERYMARMTEREHFESDDQWTAHTSGNLFNSIPDGLAVSGGWNVPRSMGLKVAAICGVAVFVVGWYWLRSKHPLLSS